MINKTSTIIRETALAILPLLRSYNEPIDCATLEKAVVLAHELYDLCLYKDARSLRKARRQQEEDIRSLRNALLQQGSAIDVTRTSEHSTLSPLDNTLTT